VTGRARAVVAGLIAGACLVARAAAAEDDAQEAEARWPLEWILRPQTLPRGMLQLDVSGQGTIPTHRDAVDPVSGFAYQFYPSFQLGLALAGGATDQLQLSAWYPRLLCLSESQPSACDPTNRYRGAGAGATYGFVRRDRLQGALTAQLQIVRSTPFELQWLVSVWLKATAPPRLAFSLVVAAHRAINPPPEDLVPSTFGSIDLEISVQAMRRLALFADLIPWAPLDRVSDGVALEVVGGASYTLSHELQVGVQGGTSNVLSNPSWNQTVPAWFVSGDLVWWVDLEPPGIIEP
jgi:hypothetical protein